MFVRMEDVSFQHALVIGGTGMLAGTTRRVARHSETVTLVARNTGPMESLVGSTPAHLVGVDYCAVDALTAGLSAARHASGEFDVVVAWIHSTGSRALSALAEMFATQSIDLRFIHVVGSGGDATVPALADLPHVTYQRVVLGHVVEAGQPRWLTHDEISAGVWQAVVSGELQSIVGVPTK